MKKAEIEKLLEAFENAVLQRDYSYDYEREHFDREKYEREDADVERLRGEILKAAED